MVEAPQAEAGDADLLASIGLGRPLTFSDLQMTAWTIAFHKAAGWTPMSLARPYLTARTRNGHLVATSVADLRTLLVARVPADMATAFADLGFIASETHSAYLLEATPDAAAGWMTARRSVNSRHSAPRDFLDEFGYATDGLVQHDGARAAAGPPIVNAILATGIVPSPDAVRRWVDTGLSAHRIGLLVAAGIGPDEAQQRPVVDAAEATLSGLVALRAGGRSGGGQVMG